jgi:hypothetical protein
VNKRRRRREEEKSAPSYGACLFISSLSNQPFYNIFSLNEPTTTLLIKKTKASLICEVNKRRRRRREEEKSAPSYGACLSHATCSAGLDMIRA